ncbi:MAG: hypothetical protein AUJ19_00285 [Parcubacteria group bacterium CG1_02_58_44]|nr:MAG: hypothetical protein AUJ19_00285 [Parcubacteria group bacterium CG1_02_58_44]
MVIGAVLVQLAAPVAVSAVTVGGSISTMPDTSVSAEPAVSDSGSGLPDIGRSVSGSLRINACGSIGTFGDRMLVRIDEQASHLAERRSGRNGRLDERIASQETGLTQVRTRQDRRRERRFDLMVGRAGDEDVLAAVSTFENAVEQALSVRRTAVDTAMDEYMTALDQTVMDRRTALDSEVTDFRSGVADAFESIQDSCTADDTVTSVRQDMNVAVRSAHENFMTNWREVRSLNAVVREVVYRRNAAFRAAWVEFKTSIEIARDELKVRLQELAPTDGSADEAAG